MKKLILLSLILLPIIKSNAQTYVSGGIYSNTTWTKAASPYVLTDTVVVFPGVTLTIEPGATVKFTDTSCIEIREAKITAKGTTTDSIIFTSNSLAKQGTIIINIGKTIDTNEFHFCKFDLLYVPIQYNYISFSPVIVKNSSFTNNEYAIYQTGRYALIDSCYFKDNTTSIYFSESTLASSPVYVSNCIIQNSWCGICGTGNQTIYKNILIDSVITGIVNTGGGLIEHCSITNGKAGISNTIAPSLEHPGITPSGHPVIKDCIIKNNSIVGIKVWEDTIINCIIDSNGVGLFIRYHTYNNCIKQNSISYNAVGIHIKEYRNLDNIYCNKICSNKNYDLFYNVPFGTNSSFPNNYFCTSDSISTRPRIFDGYIDIKYGLVNFMPMDSGCYKGLSISDKKLIENQTIKLYPNPFSDNATLEFDNPQAKAHHLSIFNTLGQSILNIENIKNDKILIDRNGLQSGMYYYRLSNSDGVVGSGKVLIE
ncbi:MAG: T9SS type A sorting domain-containing protein [Bacteroidota bacterium]